MNSVYLSSTNFCSIQIHSYPNNLKELRKKEFSQLKGVTYLDHAGSTLYSNSQLTNYMLDLKKNLYGNPHSITPSSDLMSDTIHQVRGTVLSHFNTSLDHYDVVFTSGATDAIKCLGSTFHWIPGKSKFVYLEDNHTSVVGIREIAAQMEVPSYCLSLPGKEISKCIDVFSLKSYEAILVKNASCEVVASASELPNLFAYPSQSNFSGCKYPLTWIEEVKTNQFSNHFGDNPELNQNWAVLLDAASFVSSSQLDLSAVFPDFVCLSFYKLFGFPTGLGALLVKKSAGKLLSRKTYFGGGTVDGYIARQDFYKPKSILHERIENGTVPFLDILALKYGFDFLYLTIQRSMTYVTDHTFSLSQCLFLKMKNLSHANGSPVIEVYSHSDFQDSSHQGPIIAFNVKRCDGSYVGFNHVLQLASSRDIHLRGGCFCNVGACMGMLGLDAQTLHEAYQSGHSCGDGVDLLNGRPIGAVRASFGYMSTTDDVTALVDFLRNCFVSNAATDDVPSCPLSPLRPTAPMRLEGMFLYPVKSCRAMKVNEWPLCSTGLMFDRAWMIVNDHGVCVTLKREQRLSLIQPTVDLDASTLTLESEGFDSITIPIALRANSSSARIDACQTKVCSDRITAYDCGEEVAQWLTNVLKKPVSLVYKNPDIIRASKSQDQSERTPIGLANMAQYLMLSRSSVQYLKDAMIDSCPIDLDELIARFRCNFLVSGAEPFAEEMWSEIALTPRNKITGDSVRFCVTGLCSRCSMICVESLTGKRSSEPLKTLGSLPSSKTSSSESSRRTKFGVYLSSTSTEVWLYTGSELTFKSDYVHSL